MIIYKNILKIVNRRKILILMVLLVIYYIINKVICLSLESEIYISEIPKLSCHYIDTGDTLSSAEEENFSPSSNSIFFHETSCRGGLNSRQACAVESAARAHPHYQIHVLFSAPVNYSSLNEGCLKQLQIYKNIHLARVHIIEYVKGNPLESLVVGGALNRSLWPVEHTSDVLRLITLYKWGGLYLDLDVVVARSLENLSKDWGVRESKTFIANGILALSKYAIGSLISDALVRTLANNFTGDIWGNNGPYLLTQVLQNLCSTTDIEKMSAHRCQGFEVYNEEHFFPVPWKHNDDYFKPGNLSVQNPYTYHTWNHLTQGFKIQNDSLYAKIAKKYCPKIYDMYTDSFGS